jgi:hypothetical protein
MRLIRENGTPHEGFLNQELVDIAYLDAQGEKRLNRELAKLIPALSSMGYQLALVPARGNLTHSQDLDLSEFTSQVPDA